jgi:hypothetical protein
MNKTLEQQVENVIAAVHNALHLSAEIRLELAGLMERRWRRSSRIFYAPVR